MTTTTTTNGMPAYETSFNKSVDLFFKIGASRGKDIIPAFTAAFDECPEMAARIALWARDIRGGSGERQLFRDILAFLIKNDTDIATKVLHKIPELGRFDDLFVAFGTSLQDEAISVILFHLDNNNGLCSKWCPRKGKNAAILRSAMKLSPKDYRKTLASMTNVVEQKMCAKDWENIDFSKLPSVASARYQKAFGRNASVAYGKYIESLTKGTTTINAGAVYPYDIIKSLRYGVESVANAQWNALPNYLDGSNERILCVVDVSGSMSCPAGRKGSISCMDVAVSLGLYVSERSSGAFKDKFVTFSSDPTIQSVSGSLASRMRSMEKADWNGCTDISKVFSTLLGFAKLYKVPETDMPTKILIMSDMQFNSCARYPNDTMLNGLRQRYAEAGYMLPDIIFWNINAASNAPATFNDKGVALVSGFSPAIMKGILACKNMTPYDMMLEVVLNTRYDI